MRIKPFVVGNIGTNVYLVWDETSREAMLIDPGAYDMAIERCIAENGLALKYIALTHGHGDHIDGVPNFQNLNPGVLLVACEAEAEMLGDCRINGSEAINGRGLSVVPDVLLRDGDELCLGELVFRVIETPGHTKGSVTFYIPEWDSALFDREFSGTAFTGDTLFQASVGRTDLHGGDFDTLLDSIRGRLFSLPGDTLVLPGHMNATTITYELENNPFLS